MMLGLKFFEDRPIKTLMSANSLTSEKVRIMPIFGGSGAQRVYPLPQRHVTDIVHNRRQQRPQQAPHRRRLNDQRLLNQSSVGIREDTRCRMRVEQVQDEVRLPVRTEEQQPRG